jgi:hypothetical protein
VALGYVATAASPDSKRRISKNGAQKFFEFVYKSQLKLYSLEGSEYKMKDLLKDAAFFAEGIPKFCWTQEDREKWFGSSSKHLITKPVSQTMNEILQGRDFDDSFARLLSHLRDNIAKDKTAGEATTDVAELAEFVEQAQSILKKYYDLKKVNITQFIRAKNALLSAIYVFKRYPNLKEVVK